MLYKALSEQLLEFTHMHVINRDAEHLQMCQLTGVHVLQCALKMIEDETRLSPWLHCSRIFRWLTLFGSVASTQLATAPTGSRAAPSAAWICAGFGARRRRATVAMVAT